MPPYIALVEDVSGANPPNPCILSGLPRVDPSNVDAMKSSTSCRTVREGLTEYLENALPGSTRQGFDEHLSSCQDCRRLLDEMGAVIASMPHLQREKMPRRIRDVITKALPVRDTKR